LGAKRVGLLRDLVPGAARFAVLVNPHNPNAKSIATELHAAVPAIAGQIEVFNARTPQDIDTAFANLGQARYDALLVSPGTPFNERRERLTALTAQHKLPTIYASREFAVAGGLVTYGAVLTDEFRQAGIYTGRILKGEKPADLTVMRSVKFEFVINLKTAKALGIEVPLTLLAIADEVIE
jgi:putative tryptophan/tyrosine transport system substrate-binding protein